MTLRLTTLSETLTFLQDNYTTFHTLSPSEKEKIQEQNSRVSREGTDKKDASSKEVSSPATTLRLLYIDLMMHDEMIRQSQAAHDKNRKRITVLMKNKIAIQNFIKAREHAGEVIVPEPIVLALVKRAPHTKRKRNENETQENKENKETKETQTKENKETQTKETHINEHDSQQQEMHLFQRDLIETLFGSCCSSKSKLKKLRKQLAYYWSTEESLALVSQKMIQECIVMQLKTVASFRALVSFIEVLTLL